MTKLMIAQESTINVLFTMCVIETIVIAIVGAYFTWKLYGWLEEKVADYHKKDEQNFKFITLEKKQ